MKRWVCFLGLSLLLAGVTVGSILFTPSFTQNRLSAVPAHAHMVYNNKNPDWFLSFFSMFGSREPRQAQRVPMFGKNGSEVSKHWKKSFQTLENYPLAVATVPFGGLEQRDTWVAVSELGAPAAVALRWRLMLFPPEGVSPSRSYAAWPVWKVEHSSIPTWLQVRVSITEGLLICSVSGDSHDIYKLLDIADGRAVSMANSAVK